MFRATTIARAVPAVLAAATFVNCASPNWTVEVVDGSAADVGENASAEFHVDDGEKIHTIVYADVTNDRVLAARRTGYRTLWGEFSITTVAASSARVPATAERPDGRVLVAYAQGGEPNGVVGAVRLASESGGENPTWTSEVVLNGVRLAEPPAVEYLPDPAGDVIHIVFSTVPNRRVFHAYRGVNESEWTIEDLVFHRRHPLLIAHGPDLWLFAADEEHSNVVLLHHLLGPTNTFDDWPVLGYSELQPPPNWGPERRLNLSLIEAPGSEYDGKFLLMRTSCTGPRLGYAAYGGEGIEGHLNSAPIDPTIAFCYPSGVVDADGLFYFSFYHATAGALATYVHERTGRFQPDVWELEYVDSSGDDVGRFTTSVYDPIAETVMVAYYDATNGNLKLATRPTH